MLRTLFIALAALICAPYALAQDYECQDYAKELADVGLTKCLYPFGILIAADDRFPDGYLYRTAQTMAQFIDPNRDGQPDRSEIFDALVDSGGWIPMPWDQDAWSEDEEDINDLIGFGMIAPLWWLPGEPQANGPTKKQNTLFLEEVFHLYTEMGLATVYPDEFGMDDEAQSVVSRETVIASCQYWQHPENHCPGQPAQEPDGDCSDVSCNTNEFVFAVVASMSGNDLGDHYPGLDINKAALRDVLSAEFLATVSDEKYGLPMTTFQYDYPLDKALD